LHLVQLPHQHAPEAIMSLSPANATEVRIDDDKRGTRPWSTAPGVARCIGRCAFRDESPWHHDQLLAVAGSVERAVDLLDLAITWGELDYSGEQVIEPARWPQFLAVHRWPDDELAVRLFDLAADIALRSGYAPGPVTAAGI
jgi:hypothetical protein